MNRSTMGVLLLALALANALLLGWGQGFFGGNPGSTQREPARIAAQHHRERFQLLSPEAASAALQPLQCREIGAFADEAGLLAAETALTQQLKLPAGSWQRVERGQPGVWLLATRGGDKAELARRRQQLERAGVSEFRPQSLMGERDDSWVIARFDSEEAAQAALRQLRDGKALRDLRVVTQRVASSQWWLRLPGLEAHQLKATNPAWPGGLRPCQADPAPPASAASAG